MLGWDDGWWGGVDDEDGSTSIRKIENWIQLLCLKVTAASKVKSIVKQEMLSIHQEQEGSKWEFYSK